MAPSGNQHLVQETGDFSPENNPFCPTEDTLNEDESACNKSSNETFPPLVKPRTLQLERITQPFSYSHVERGHHFQLSNTHIRTRQHPTWYPTQATSSQESLSSEQALENIPPLISFPPSQYSTDSSLSINEYKPLFRHSNTGGYTRVSGPHRRTASAPLAPKLALSSPSGSISHSPFPHKRFPHKTPSDGSTDSGVEMVRFITPSAAPSGYSIEPWMSVANEYQYWMQPRPRVIEPWMSVSQDKEQFEQSLVQQRPRVTSVSTAVQTELEGEDGSEKTASPASGTPRTPSSFQHPHAGIDKPYAPLTQ